MHYKVHITFLAKMTWKISEYDPRSQKGKKENEKKKNR